jgi:hypothetical protein
MGKLRKRQLSSSLSLVSYHRKVRFIYLILISSYVIHDTKPNDGTQNEHKDKVTRQRSQITKLFPENKAVT